MASKAMAWMPEIVKEIYKRDCAVIGVDHQ